MLKLYYVVFLLFISSLSFAQEHHELCFNEHSGFSSTELEIIHDFLSEHWEDLESLSHFKVPSSWEVLGNGNSKHAYAHPSLTNLIFKFRYVARSIEDLTPALFNDLQSEFEIIQEISEFVKKHSLTSIKIPKILFINYMNLKFQIVERINPEKDMRSLFYFHSVQERETALSQLEELKIIFGFCDIDPRIDRLKNVWWVEEKTEKTLSLVLYDLNCFQNEPQSLYHYLIIEAGSCVVILAVAAYLYQSSTTAN